MTRQLMHSWAEHDAALDRLVGSTQHSLRIFDEDLTRLKLETPSTYEHLRRFLSTPQARFIVVLRNPEPFRRFHPRTNRLLRDFAHVMTVTAAPDHLISLTDNLLLADDVNALIRFHRDHARSKLIVDDSAECHAYRKRFEEIMLEGGEPLSATALGL